MIRHVTFAFDDSHPHTPADVVRLLAHVREAIEHPDPEDPEYLYESMIEAIEALFNQYPDGVWADVVDVQKT